MRGQKYCREHLVVEAAPLGTDVEIARQVEAAGQKLRVRASTEVVNPASGEIITLGQADTTTLAGYLLDARAFKVQVDEAVKLVENEIVDRMDAQARWTVDSDWGKLVSSSPDRGIVISDAQALRAELLEAGYEPGVVAAAIAEIHPPPEYTINRAGLNALRKLEQANRIIRRYEVPGPEKLHRRVDVKPRAR